MKPPSAPSCPSFQNFGRLGVITLNRSRSLNALTISDIDALSRVLTAWQNDAAVDAVAIRAEPGRAFCAGGDVRAFYAARLRGETDFSRTFYAREYRLNLLIARYAKPLIALTDGIVMGGGAGISVHGRFRVGSEALRFAMPETGIGFFPDVGGTYFLSRLRGAMGEYLGLTGTAIGIADAIDLGLFTHHVPAAGFAALIEDLAAAPHLDELSAAKILSAHAVAPAKPTLRRERAQIDRVFSRTTMSGIQAALALEDDDFAAATRKILAVRCPTSLCVTLEAIRRARNLDLEECLRMEYRVADRCLRRTDLYEGIRAALEDRDQMPVWLPADVDGVHQGLIDAHFAPLSQGREWDAAGCAATGEA